MKNQNSFAQIESGNVGEPELTPHQHKHAKEAPLQFCFNHYPTGHCLRINQKVPIWIKSLYPTGRKAYLTNVMNETLIKSQLFR